MFVHFNRSCVPYFLMHHASYLDVIQVQVCSIKLWWDPWEELLTSNFSTEPAMA